MITPIKRMSLLSQYIHLTHVAEFDLIINIVILLTYKIVISSHGIDATDIIMIEILDTN